MNIAVLAYPKMTALDAIGPYEILSRLPGADLKFVGEEVGPIMTDTGFLTIMAEAGISDIDSADILVVPGGFGDRQVRRNENVLEWVRNIHETTRWTVSVCTGSLILGAAGLLKGLRATTHWAQLDTLREFGAEPATERVVEQGKIITAAGVSAGIDMALHLSRLVVGDEFAQAVQLGIEYDPQPPFDAGSPAKAPASIVELVRTMMSSREES